MSYLEWDEHEKENDNNRKNSSSFFSLISKLYLRNTCDVWFYKHLSRSSYNLFKAHTLLMEKSCRSKHDSWHHRKKETRLLDQTQEVKLMKSLQVQSRLMKISVCCMIWVKRGWNRKDWWKPRVEDSWRKHKKLMTADLGFISRNSIMYLKFSGETTDCSIREITRLH